MKPSDANFVSCDIVGHGREKRHARQVAVLEALNAIIAEPVRTLGPDRAVWASGGDGGHVAFLDDRDVKHMLELLRELHRWATKRRIPLRLTAHRGPVSLIEGADQRPQLVGHGINLCGSLVDFGFPGVVVASEAFRSFLENARRKDPSLPELAFTAERTIYLKHFNANRLWILSLRSDGGSEWHFARSDHRGLEEASEAGRRWMVIYHAKRLLQVDSKDPVAQRALDELDPKKLLTIGDDPAINPLLGFLGRRELKIVIDEAQLVERDSGEVLCERGDEGDTMFVILKGQVGVVTNQRPAESAPRKPVSPADIRHGEGEIVGELALALNRPRTATLQAIGPTAMLAISYSRLEHLLDEKGRLARISAPFESLLLDRTLQHLYRNADYLSLHYDAARQKKDPEPWDRMVAGAERITIEPRDAHRVSVQHYPAMGGKGLCILGSGQLVGPSAGSGMHKVVSGEDFGILFANLPGEVVDLNREYRIDSDAAMRRVVVLRISDESLAAFARERYAEMIEAVKMRLASQMLFDVFISYSGEDEERALAWKDALDRAGLRVYMNVPDAMRRFQREIEAALAESLVLMPIISHHAVESKWVAREISRRREIFDVDHANILPIELEKGLAEKIADGFSPIACGAEGSESERRALASATKTIREVREGKRSLPFASGLTPPAEPFGREDSEPSEPD